MKRVRTETFIAAPPIQVRQVLADFDGYAGWNPLNIKAAGRAVPGAKIPMTFRNPARAGATVDMTVTLTACEPGRRLEWVGRIPLLFGPAYEAVNAALADRVAAQFATGDRG